MKYFAKYLPVEGEINIRDKAVGSDGKIIDCNKSNYLSIQEHWRKVKLFLCSRDIQVGDKFFDRFNVERECTAVIDGEFVYCQFGPSKELDTLRFLKINCFKVIGEISPEAI